VATVPLPLGAELTPPDEGCRLLELLEEDDEEDDCAVELDPVDETPVAAWLDVDAVPGMVAAPMAANTPTAATAAAPAQNVSRLSSWTAASRASMRVASMGVSLSNVAGLEMGTTCEFAERVVPPEGIEPPTLTLGPSCSIP
jgi:hypothetical protein